MVDSGIVTCDIIRQESEALVDAMCHDGRPQVMGVVRRMRTIMASAGICKVMLEMVNDHEEHE